VFDLRTSQQITQLTTAAEVTSIEISFDGHYFTTTDGRSVKFWSTSNLQQLKEFTLPFTVESASFCPAKRKFAAGACRGRCRRWASASAASARLAGWVAPSSSGARRLLRAATRTPQRSAPPRLHRHHPPTARPPAGGDDMWVRLYNAETGAELEVLKGHHGPVHTVRFGPDGKEYASGSEDGTIRIWQTDFMVDEGEGVGSGGL
jgi:WD40 repeat protein